MIGDEKDLIIFLDEDDKRKEIYVTIVELKDSFVTFRTSSNLITIPINRVLKIKRKEMSTNEGPN